MHQDTNIQKILSVRRFNRFYTQEFGFLHKRMLSSDHSLVEARVVYELANRRETTASEIAAALKLDAGYLSRILKKFEESGHLQRSPSATDARSMRLSLTEKGSKEATDLAVMATADIAEKFKGLSRDQLHDMVSAMQTIEKTLGHGDTKPRAAIIRDHRPGDIGWVISSQSKYYADTWGLNEGFEALVTRIAADFISDYDPKVEHCWIAEVDGRNVGSIFLIREDDTTAKLRLFYVDESARGLGLGSRLLEECMSFAERAGYDRIVLYTNAILAQARRLYEKAGFTLTSEDEHTDFGDPQVGQNWLHEFSNAP